MAILMGVYPALFLSPMESSVRQVVERVQVARPVTAERKAPPAPVAPAAPRVERASVVEQAGR
jgi:hypothetical protein